MKRDDYMQIRVPAALKKRVSDMAHAEKRTIAAQVEYLIERQLDEMDGLRSIQAQELAGFMAGGQVLG